MSYPDVILHFTTPEACASGFHDNLELIFSNRDQDAGRRIVWTNDDNREWKQSNGREKIRRERKQTTCLLLNKSSYT